MKVLGNDALRYYLLRETVFGQDGNFSREALITRYNADLANGLGNLASRVLTMIENYFGGAVPDRPAVSAESPFLTAQIKLLVLDNYEQFNFSAALQAVWRLISQVDGYLVEKAPWKMASTPEKSKELAEVLYTAAEAVRIISILVHPVLPDATQNIWKNLGQTGNIEDQNIHKVEWGGLVPRHAYFQAPGDISANRLHRRERKD